jgi:hypothetical protein
MVMTTTQKTEFALIDSGATENFINPRTVERLQLPMKQLPHPRIIYNIDGTLNKAGSITHKCQLRVQFKDILRTIDFFITDLGQDRAVLGFPFLKEFNPEINWDTGVISPTNQIFITPQQIWEHQWKVWRQDGKLLRKADLLHKVSFAQQWSAIADKTKEHLKESGIPPKYQIHQQVFSEEGAKRLPPNRSEDMAITLKEGAPEQLDCKVYPLSSKELGILRQSLNKDLAKGYIGIIMGWAYLRVWRAGFQRGGCGFEISTCDPTLTRSAGWRVPVQV